MTTPQEFYNGTPRFKPRKISSTISQALTADTKDFTSTTPVSTDYVPVSQLQSDLDNLKTEFATTQALLDNAGQNLSLCLDVPAAVRERVARQKDPNETCWDFYKRMLAITYEYPTITLDGDGFSNSLADAGNDIVSDPFTNDEFGVLNNYDNNYDLVDQNPTSTTSTSGYDENPGKSTLLMMLFLAVLKLIVSAVFGVLKYPLKMLNRNTGYTADGVAAANTAGSDALPPSGPAAVTANFLWNITKKFIQAFAFQVGINLAISWVEKKISAGPKLNRDVERFDAVIVTGHIQNQARYSTESGWPDAVLLTNQVVAMQQQSTATQSVANYYNSSSLQNNTSSTGQNEAQIPQDMYTVLSQQTDQMSNSLGRINGAMQSPFGTDIMCCLFRYLGSFDDKFLKTAKAILLFSINKQALRFEKLDSALSNLWQVIKNAILGTMMSILSNLMQSVNNNLKSSLVIPNTSIANQCVSWNLFVQTMLEYIQNLEKSLLELMVEFNGQMRSQDKFQSLYIDGLQNSQKARKFLQIIDLILAAKASGELCNGTTIPTDAELTALYDQIKSTVGAPTTTTVNGTNTSTTTTATAVANSAINTVNFETCLKNIPANDVAKVQAWIAALKGQS